jgi:cell division protein FtsB
MKATEILIKILKNTFNKYLIVFIGVGVWILLFDENNLVKHRQNLEELKQLQGQVEFYKQKITADKQKLYELQTNDENLEKFAREQFLMKRANEDIFVIVEEE